jgi:LysR family hydrogen peroxide-inducible transcriptional activator
MEGTTLTTLVQMVSSGIGVTLIPEMAVPFETKFTKVSVSRFIEQKPKRTVGVIWRKSNILSSHYKAIGDILKNHLK